LVAVPVLVSLGALVGRTVGIHPKRYDDWLEVPNFWGAVVMRPGLLKTPAIAEATRFLKDLARQAREEYEVAAREADSRVAVLEARIDRLKATMRTRGTSEEQLDGLGEALGELIQEVREARVTERRYYTQDPTTEKLGELLRDNPRGLLVLRDELAGWLRTLDKPGREGDREFYLEGWDGKGSYIADRIKRGTIHIPCHTISVFGGTQPGKLRAYIAGALDPEGPGADGLLQRFQILVWPDEAPPWENHDRVPNLVARERAGKIFQVLDKLTTEALGLDPPIPGSIPALRFNDEAQDFFNSWRDRLERRLRSVEMSARPAFESHLAKYRSLMPTLALLFFLVDWAAGEQVIPLRVGLDHASRAAAWCDYLEMHATKVFALEGPESAAQNLADRIREGNITDGMSFREIYRHHWGTLDTPEKLRAAVEVLERAGWVRVQDIAPEATGRPSPVLRINPKLGRTP
jgi:putative DNA primase/helicase